MAGIVTSFGEERVFADPDSFYESLDRDAVPPRQCITLLWNFELLITFSEVKP
jgi:hypothetical protein